MVHDPQARRLIFHSPESIKKMSTVYSPEFSALVRWRQEDQWNSAASYSGQIWALSYCENIFQNVRWRKNGQIHLMPTSGFHIHKHTGEDMVIQSRALSFTLKIKDKQKCKTWDRHFQNSICRCAILVPEWAFNQVEYSGPIRILF